MLPLLFIGQQSSEYFDFVSIQLTLVSSFSHLRPSCLAHFQMLTGRGVPITGSPQEVLQYFLVRTLFHGVLRNRRTCPVQVLKPKYKSMTYVGPIYAS
jgi:hypothetical protein